MGIYFYIAGVDSGTGFAQGAQIMVRNMLMGIAAGAAGTVALNIITYLDMLIRGRPSSDVPAQTAEKLTRGAGIQPAQSPASNVAHRQQNEHQAENRNRALGALLGYVAGLGVGAAYGAIRPALGDAPLPLSGLALAAAAMAAGDLPSVLSGATNPRDWGVAGWVSDLVPHVAYGYLTALAYEAFTAGEIGRYSGSPARYLGAAANQSYTRLGG